VVSDRISVDVEGHDTRVHPYAGPIVPPSTNSALV
jgi:hypothetical protein